MPMKELERIREKLDHVLRNGLAVEQSLCRLCLAASGDVREKYAKACFERRREMFEELEEFDSDISAILRKDSDPETGGAVQRDKLVPYPGPK